MKKTSIALLWTITILAVSHMSPITAYAASGPGSHMSSYEEELLTLVNEVRTEEGLAPLSLCDGMNQAAETRTLELEESFSHQRPDGSKFSTALTLAGVTFKGAGENVAYGYLNPEHVMEGWMNSEGHKDNILNPDYTAIGIGHHKSKEGIHYWTQLFIW